MTKKRLKELIKQGETIYDVGNGTVRQIDLSEHGVDNYYIAESDYLALNSRRPYMTVYAWDIECLYETKEQAEWALKTVSERTERFEPPMWEDIENTYQFKFVVKYGKVQEFYTFDIRKDLKDDWAITIDNGGIIFESEPTKENYIKACEIVRDLFNKGGAKC